MTTNLLRIVAPDGEITVTLRHPMTLSEIWGLFQYRLISGVRPVLATMTAGVATLIVD